MKMNKAWLEIVLMALASCRMAGAQQIWTGSAGNGLWNTTSINWSSGGSGSVYADGDTVQFDDSAAQGTIGIVLPVAPSSILVSNSATPYQFSGSPITGIGGLDKEGGGTLILASSNSFSGGIVLNASVAGSGSPSIISRAAGALGSGPLTLYGGTYPAPSILQFETSPYANVIANDIVITGAEGYVVINARVPTWLTGSLDAVVPHDNLAFGCPGGDRGGSSYLVIAPGPGRTVNIASNCNIDCGDGWRLLVDFTSISNLPPTVGLNAGGCAGLVLSPGFTWSNLVSGRAFSGASALRGPFWSGNCFAARGSDQVIDGSGAFKNDYGNSATNNWLTGGVSLYTPLFIGSPLTNADGSFYANAGIKIARDITLSGMFPVAVASTGPGLTRPTASGIFNEFAGTIDGPGVMVLASNGRLADSLLPELVLSGTSRWSSGLNAGLSGTWRVMTGPGGMATYGNYTAGFTRFKGQSSLPSGNAGATAYILALANMGAPNPCGMYGYLLTGSEGSPQVYSLTNGMRFLIGGDSSDSVGPFYGVLGSAIGQAVLTNSAISIYNNSQALQYLSLLVRDTNSTLVLGSDAGSVAFNSCIATNTSYPGVSDEACTSLPAEPMFDRFTRNILIKRGSGALVLSNVTYELFAGGGNIVSNFSWQLGNGTVGQDEGVVRETGTGINNSMRTLPVLMNGGVLGLATDYAVQVGTNAAQVDFSGNGGGGFAAYGRDSTVTLTTWGVTNRLGWGAGSAALPEFFMKSSAPMILNARDADSAVTVASAPGNAISLVSGGNHYVIQVQDNTATNTDKAVLAIRLTSASTLGGATLVKTGPGVLVLSATNNDYEADTIISNGTLVVDGSIQTNRMAAASNVTVCAGAALSGTGAIMRAVSVLSGGTLAAGDPATQTGTLTIGGDLVMSAGSSLLANVSASGSCGAVSVLGTAQVSGIITGYVGGAVSGDTLLLQAAGGINTNGMTAQLPRGYVIRLGNGGQQLNLHYTSPGFIIRIE